MLAETMIEEGEAPSRALEEQSRLRSGASSPERLALWIGAIVLGG